MSSVPTTLNLSCRQDYLLVNISMFKATITRKTQCSTSCVDISTLVSSVLSSQSCDALYSATFMVECRSPALRCACTHLCTSLPTPSWFMEMRESSTFWLLALRLRPFDFHLPFMTSSGSTSLHVALYDEFTVGTNTRRHHSKGDFTPVIHNCISATFCELGAMPPECF